jgi:enamine deaminase RidA (YjgF/YER057c/UK114 family)
MRQPPSPAQIHRYAHLRNYCRKPRLRALALLYISGEVGVLPDGTVLETIEAQAEAYWRNIIAILAESGANRRSGNYQSSWVADSELRRPATPGHQSLLVKLPKTGKPVPGRSGSESVPNFAKGHL